MASFKEDDRLISKLLNETYEVLPVQNVSKSSQDLSDYFNQKSSVSEFNNFVKEIEKFSEKSKVFATSLEFIPQTKCYKAKANFGQIDFPSNWSMFEIFHELELNSVIENREEELGALLIEGAEAPVVFLIKSPTKHFLVAVDSSREFEYKWIKSKIESLNFQKVNHSSKSTKIAI
ncbi:MAG: hypothetical protein Fur0010_07450 [Bdellovibrio sp.]